MSAVEAPCTNCKCITDTQGRVIMSPVVVREMDALKARIAELEAKQAPATSTPFEDMDAFMQLRVIDPEAFQVLRMLASRVVDGAAQYGKLDLLNDKRNPFKEAAEEVADGLFYMGIVLARAKRDLDNTTL